MTFISLVFPDDGVVALFDSLRVLLFTSPVISIVPLPFIVLLLRPRLPPSSGVRSSITSEEKDDKSGGV